MQKVHPDTKRIFLTHLLLCHLITTSIGQSWAVKILPLTMPTVNQNWWGGIGAIEYTFANRHAIQLGGGALYGLANLADSDYRARSALVGFRHYTGQRPIHRAWFYGINMHHFYYGDIFPNPAFGNTFFTAPDGSPLGRTREEYFVRASGIFGGKNIGLGRHWFIETKIAIEYIRLHEKLSYVTSSGTEHLREQTEFTFLPRPSILFGYRFGAPK